MRLLKYIVISATLLCTSLSLFAQQQAVIKGSVKGTVKDNEQNHLMSSATISLYKASDSTLIAYQIADTYGAFSFKDVIVNQLYYVELTNMGYQTQRRSFTITKPGEMLDLGVIDLKHASIALNEVVVRVPPVSMNGDTLEFNPSAFKLDSNAVVEDLLRKIPNVTVWSDGLITVNGREIKTLLVNGRPFFGGSFKVATQNLPKNVVERIQVYRDENTRNPLDSNLIMNVKLKKDKQIGLFGKLSAGGGTSGRFETDGNINIFSKQMQITLGAAANNTNKVFNSIDTLLASSTYKGSTNELDYQSDFRLPGINKTFVGGGRIYYDFEKVIRPGLKNNLAISVFNQRKDSEVDLNSVTLNTVNNGSSNLSQLNSSTSRNNTLNQFNAAYNFRDHINSLNVNADFYRRGLLSDNVNLHSVTNNGLLSSTNNSRYKDSSNTNNFFLNVAYQYFSKTNINTGKRIGFIPFSVAYTGTHNETSIMSNRSTQFVSFVNPSASNTISRKYDNSIQSSKNAFDLSLPNIDDLFFTRINRYYNLTVSNKYRYDTQTQDDKVQDMESGIFKPNNYLSNRLNTSVTRNTSTLNFSIPFQSEHLTNRYDKDFVVIIDPTIDRFNFKTSSEKDFQNFNRSYTTFFTDIGVSKRNNIFGKHKRDISIKYHTEINIPTINQLAALTDSTQMYYLRFGNPRLKKESIRQINASYSWADLKSTNPFSYQIDAYYHFADSKITDSIFITADNRQLVFSANAGKYSSLGSSFDVRKSFKFKSSDIRLHLWGNIFSQNLPIYINDKFVINKNLNSRLSFAAAYGLSDNFLTEFRETIDFYETEQPEFNIKYSGTTLAHALNLNLNVTKNLVVNTNITLSENRSTGRGTTRFTIWNAFLSYRFLKNGNGVIKLSTLDILRENTSIVNNYGINSFTTLTRNVLQQYFLASFIYYPRAFGGGSKR